MKPPAEGTLRGIATFLATFGIGVATYIAIAESGGGSPVCMAGGNGCQTVAESAYSQLLGVNVAIFGIVGYVLLLGAALLRGDGARMAGFARRPGRLRLQPLPDLPGALHDRGDLPVVRGQRRADDAALRANATRMLAYVGRPHERKLREARRKSAARSEQRAATQA